MRLSVFKYHVQKCAYRYLNNCLTGQDFILRDFKISQIISIKTDETKVFYNIL